MSSSDIALDYRADHILKNLQGFNNLLFAGYRRSVEAVANRLRTRSDKVDLPNEYFPHPGSLSKELREELEAPLKKAELPKAGVATITLEFRAGRTA